ncbi:MAG: hypothetical protein B7W99_00990 [Rhodospirillales bacterium 20-58-10]|nr:MAG: hypothetical protein B7W99_00990 [Rhodospirillales bacterium 20-58-10]
MTAKRDSQRSRVYAWENRVVAPDDPSFVSFSEAQGVVNAIWAELGLKYPPKVEVLPRQAKKTVATATRLSIRLPDRVPSWCLLHEIAHAMTTTVDSHSDGHNGMFMGVYIRLLAHYLRLNVDNLMRSARSELIEVTVNARPVFRDV